MFSSNFNNIIKTIQPIKNVPQSIKTAAIKTGEKLGKSLRLTNNEGNTIFSKSPENKVYDDNYKLYNLKIIKSKKDGKVLLLDTDVKKIYKAGEYIKADSGEVLNDYEIVKIPGFYENGTEKEPYFDNNYFQDSNNINNIAELIKNADTFKTNASRKRSRGGRRPRRKTVKRNRTRRVKKYAKIV